MTNGEFELVHKMRESESVAAGKVANSEETEAISATVIFAHQWKILEAEAG